ncbi:hypothetical protein AGDE_14592 [Angomonas deanei]|uniref:Uncharacterized protein n=1 Tax=Angomonas deanei TaxID=59799 RepID=A0A7G2CQD1_9TRYP|nr:hypothetical protein AGDE_14592 [Angomonas deanei]CAD2222066.1 hypothetical protein, conserved [Angomonas deanei]|eukprot:EPY20574.1 hypothetical protein AGDE_14592 [Angomonas deanei]
MFKQVAWLEDDTIVCTGGDDGNIYFWDTHSGALLHTTKGDEDVVNGVLGHPGGGTLYACGIDSTIKVLRPATTVTAETEERRLKTYHQAAAAHVAEHVRAPGFGMSAAQFMEMLLTGPQSGSGESSSSSAEDSQGGAAESSPMTSLASSSEEEEGASPHLDPMYFCLRSAQAFTGCLRRSALFQTKLLLAVQEHTSLQQLKIIRSHLAMQSDLVDSDLSTPESGEEEEEEDEPSEFPARVVLDAITTETESEGGDDVASEETPEEESASDGGLLRDAEPSDWGQVLSLVTSLIEPANQDTEDSTSEETTTSSTSSPVYDDDDAYDSDGVSSGREGRGARVTRASVTAMMDRLYTTPEADTQFIAMSAALLRLSEQLEKRLLAWKLPPCCVKDGDDMVQHFNWEKCTYGRFAMAKQQTSTASDDPLDTDRIAQMQRCDEQAQYIKLLLDFMSLLLEGKEPLYKNESLKQEYWGKVA